MSASEVHGSLTAVLGATTAVLLLARTFSAISLKKKHAAPADPRDRDLGPLTRRE
jgi:hypothetical protein